MTKTDAIIATLKQNAKELGVTLKDDLRDTAQYTLERADHLASLIGDPNWDQAASAEADAVALHAGVNAVSAGDEADDKMRTVIRSVIGFLAMLAAA